MTSRTRAGLCAALLGLVCTPAHAQEAPGSAAATPAPARLLGTLRERGTRKPLPGFTVRLAPGDREALTDADGRFGFDDLPPGEVTVSVADPLFEPLTDVERLGAGASTEVVYYLERTEVGDDALVVSGARAKARKEVVRRTVTPTETRTVAGTNGDALKVVQNLPGVARVPFGGGGLVIRGSNPDDSIAYINRHDVPLAFHFGGLRSTFTSALMESIDFYPGNFGAEFGPASGGVVDVRIRRPRADGLHGYAEADLYDAGAMLEGPVTENATFAVAARRSYIDAVLPTLLPEDDGLALTTAPRYYDYQGVYDWQSGGHRLRLMAYGAGDVLALAVKTPGDDAGFRGDFRAEQGFHRLFAAWNARLTPALENELSVSGGPNHSLESLGEDLVIDIDTLLLHVREDMALTISDALRLRGGYSGELFRADAHVLAPQPTKEGEVDAPLSASDRIAFDGTLDGAISSAWFEAEVKPVAQLTLLPALRFDHFSAIHDATLDPRLNVRWQVAEGTVLVGGAGLYSNTPQVEEYVKGFGNPDLKMERSRHYSLGVEQRLTEALSLDTQVFYKDLYHQAVRVDDTRVQYRNQGDGRVGGLEMLLRHAPTAHFFGWLSYTLMRAERRDAPEADWRLADTDQTHILTVLGQYTLNPRWSFGARWRFVSGQPETPFTGAVYDTDGGSWVPVPGRVNSERLPPFHALDLRVDRRWIFDTWVLTGYLDLQNAYNRQNPEGFQYDYAYRQRATVSGLPILPSFGVRGDF
jgi:hypothetical protein